MAFLLSPKTEEIIEYRLFTNGVPVSINGGASATYQGDVTVKTGDVLTWTTGANLLYQYVNSSLSTVEHGQSESPFNVGSVSGANRLHLEADN